MTSLEFSNFSRNDFYGSEWASFAPRQITNWVSKLIKNGPIKNVEFDDIEPISKDFKTCINLDNNPLFSAGEMVELLIQEGDHERKSFIF